jgi:Na+-driven multidrug efflux pump
LYKKSLKILFLVLLVIIVPLIFCIKYILYFWIGSDFADKTWIIAVILLIGLFFNGLSFAPFAVTQSIGNPKTTASMYIIEAIIYIPILIFSIKKFGLIGAAVATSLRVFFEMIILLAMARNTINSESNS